MAKLTATGVEKWKITDKRQEVPDSLMTGLYLVVQPSGRKGWQVRYRFGKKHRRMTLGKYPLLSLAEARTRASEVLIAAQDGRDPAGEKEAETKARVEIEQSGRDKVSTLVDQFGKRHLSKLKTGEAVKREMDRHVVAAWGERDVHHITKRDVIDLLDGIADSGRVVTANRVRAYLSKFLNWCVERDIIDQSPAIGIKPVAKEQSRERVLSDDEIRWLWIACTRHGQPWGHLCKMLLLTGQRLGEVAKMTDDEVSGDLWHLDADRTKNGRAHDVPLSEPARDVLESVKRIKGDKGYVFTTTGRSPLQGYHKGRNYIGERMAEVASEELGEPVVIPHWTFHDLRRTAATGMARLGIPVRVTEAVLNHVSGSAGGIVSVYQRHDYADEKRDALNAWARMVVDLVEGTADNVVRIGEARA
ncbi:MULTISPECIES: tyrosine-type recombinase/integrase [unclassified Sulfitobacter]|uniref:tyrosine-type recombinase/integrase n=1 Tax=unclassified Sulfitobacter TaxID=196795 RepID=UPI0007C353E9|nr:MULTISPECIES: site-specific integrase [unclassified Sulfitobacter]KZX94493.1 integrase [Sulfitobacter sp. HI0021]KZY02151.1 integrase [Sulfitobacter sp. HI0027]KZZ02577.1 integrase [Sulfitobacter sp. HI0076]